MAVTALVGVAALTATGLNRPLDLKVGDFGAPVLGVLSAVLVSAALVFLAERFVGAADRVSALASIGLVVVLTHGVPLYYFHERVAPWPLAGMALGIGLMCGVIAIRTPISRYLIGR